MSSVFKRLYAPTGLFFGSQKNLVCKQHSREKLAARDVNTSGGIQHAVILQPSHHDFQYVGASRFFTTAGKRRRTCRVHRPPGGRLPAQTAAPGAGTPRRPRALRLRLSWEAGAVTGRAHSRQHLDCCSAAKVYRFARLVSRPPPGLSERCRTFRWVISRFKKEPKCFRLVHLQGSARHCRPDTPGTLGLAAQMCM